MGCTGAASFNGDPGISQPRILVQSSCLNPPVYRNPARHETHTCQAPVRFLRRATYKDWMDGTRLGLLNPRSGALSNLDTAIQGGDKGRIITALQSWVDTKKDWKQSKRNRNGTVTELAKWLNYAPTKKPSIADANLDLATQAIAYVKTKVKYSSSNQRLDVVASLGRG